MYKTCTRIPHISILNQKYEYRPKYMPILNMWWKSQFESVGENELINGVTGKYQVEFLKASNGSKI